METNKQTDRQTDRHTFLFYIYRFFSYHTVKVKIVKNIALNWHTFCNFFPQVAVRLVLVLSPNAFVLLQL